MNKLGEVNMFEIILLVVIVGLIVSYMFGWLSFGKEISTTPTKNELPQSSETQENQTETGEVVKFQKCTVVSDCNWDYTKYYNRNCTEGGRWRCLESPVVGEFLCDYGCYLNNTNGYCGDGVCSGEEGSVESSWTCWDCDRDVASIGKLIIS